MTGERKQTETMPLVVLNVNGEAPDKQPLVNNYSVNSFITENNELTVTRSSIRDPRKFSTMKFKPTDKHQIDIEIMHGKHTNGLQDFGFQQFGSQAIRRQYSSKAKCMLASVFLMLFVMLIVLVVCLTFGKVKPPKSSSDTVTHSFGNFTSARYMDNNLNKTVTGHNYISDNTGTKPATTNTGTTLGIRTKIVTNMVPNS